MYLITVDPVHWTKQKWNAGSLSSIWTHSIVLNGFQLYLKGKLNAYSYTSVGKSVCAD